MSKRRCFLSVAGAAIVLFAGVAIAQTTEKPKIYKVGEGVTPPKVLYKIDPDYTAEAHDAGLQGTVLLSLVVAPDGMAQDIQVLQGLGSGLNEKAVEAIRKWRFAPGMKDGEPVAVTARIEVNFRLK